MTVAIERPPVAAPPLTWEWVVRIEPRLARLLADIQQIRDDGQGEYFCRNEVWYGWGVRGGGYKREMYALVGLWAADPLVATSHAYDVAYRTLYNALPPCRGPCGCGW